MVLRVGGNSGLIGFWILSMSGVPKNTKNTPFRELVLFSFSGQGGGNGYSLGSIRKRTEGERVSETLWSLEYLTMDKF
jgi:hypothetical protein